ncbi:MAG TPA: hypothetical protein VJA00_02510, partial [Candidatus Omnitrophota bacterium]|nr:hypothetical protein [Candidatus Omnitrophota bacterium]
MGEHLESHHSDSGKSFKRPEKSWIAMSKEQRNEVYQTHKEALAGDLSMLREQLGNTVWNEVAGPEKNYGIQATGQTISRVMLDTFSREKGNLGGRTPKEVMFYALDYLQNGAENQGNADNIDQVEKDDIIQIYNEGGRWRLRLTQADGSVRINAHLFPPKPEVAKVEEPDEVIEEPAEVVKEPDPTEAAVVVERETPQIDLSKFDVDKVFKIDTKTGAVTVDITQVDYLIEAVREAELDPEMGEDWNRYLISILEHFRENIKGVTFENKKIAATEIIGHLGQAMKDAIPESNLSEAVKGELGDAAENFSAMEESIGGLVVSIETFEFNEEDWNKLEDVLSEHVEYFKSKPELQEIGKEGKEVLEATGNLAEDFEALESALPDAPTQSLGMLPGYPDFRAHIRLDETGQLTVDADDLRAILEDPEQSPGLTEAQRAFYIQVSQTLETKIGEGTPSEQLIGLLTGLGESIKEALPASTLDQALKVAFEKVADGLISVGNELEEFMQAWERLKDSGKIEELIPVFRERMRDIVTFFQETSPYKEVLEASASAYEAFITFKRSFQEAMEVAYMENRENEP